MTELTLYNNTTISASNTLSNGIATVSNKKPSITISRGNKCNCGRNVIEINVSLEDLEKIKSLICSVLENDRKQRELSIKYYQKKQKGD